MSAFAHLMRDTIDIRRLAAISGSGTKNFDPPRTMPPAQITGRLSFRRKLIAAPDGREIVSEATVYTLEPLRVGDLVIQDGREWPVLLAHGARGLFGVIDHWEVMI